MLYLIWSKNKLNLINDRGIFVISYGTSSFQNKEH